MKVRGVIGDDLDRANIDLHLNRQFVRSLANAGQVHHGANGHPVIHQAVPDRTRRAQAQGELCVLAAGEDHGRVQTDDFHRNRARVNPFFDRVVGGDSRNPDRHRQGKSED